MGTRRTLTPFSKRDAPSSALACLVAAVLILASAMASAQGVSPTNKPREDLGFFGNIGRWFDEQGQWFNSTFTDAGRGVQNFGREAGIAAKTTAQTAKEAADAMARLPNARVVVGHEKCKNAPNGAPDCLAAAVSVCKAKGFGSGTSVDMTTAEVCPPKALVSGRGECKTETFVSRVLCQ